MRIAVDAFGGDNAPAAVVEGCIDALKKYPDMSVTLCGDSFLMFAKHPFAIALRNNYCKFQ